MIHQNISEHLTKEQRDAIDLNVTYDSEGFFIPASADDEKDYREWAREHFQAENNINPVWHPVIIDECIKIINETYNNGNI